MGLLPLDSRQMRIARLLVEQPDTTRVEQVASSLRLTDRVVRYNLPTVEAYLTGHGLRLVKRRGVGIWVDGDRATRTAVIADLATAAGPAVLDADDRQAGVLLALLEAAPEPVRSEDLEARLGVSRPTIRRDVRVAEAWLEQHRLHLRRLPGVGLSVRGSEVEVRAGLVALILERVPANVLDSHARDGAARGVASGAGLEGYVASLDLPTFRQVLVAELRTQDEHDPTVLTATLSLAIVVARVRAGRHARLVRGRLRSLLDHPVAESADRIAAAVTVRLSVDLGRAEAAAITESLLGFVELTHIDDAAAESDLIRAVDRLAAVAAERLHPALGDDELLRGNLIEHFRRLQVRLRYGLPVSNPLQHDVQKRYPDVYRIAEGLVGDLGRFGGAAIPVEEVGFLTMYLAGSLERHRLRAKVRVTVVCPAGMATAWILVSRLLAEFPQVEVGKVISKAAFEEDISEAATELVISTVPLDDYDGQAPLVIVSPLLNERDVRRLTRLVGLPSHTRAGR
jgi:activator of the mannose operon (transcriptional antiterminator)